MARNRRCPRPINRLVMLRAKGLEGPRFQNTGSVCVKSQGNYYGIGGPGSGVSALSGVVLDANTIQVRFSACVSISGTTGIQYQIDGGSWTTVTGYIKNLLTADPFDVNAHTAQNGLTLTPGNKSLLTFPASAGAHLQLAHPVLGAGTSRLGWAAWTDSGTKDFRIDIYDATAGHVAVDRTATTTRQWFSADLTLTGTNNLARVQNDVAGTAGTMHVENLYLSEASGPSVEPASNGTAWTFTTGVAIQAGDDVRWRYVGGSNSIVDCTDAEDIGDQEIVVNNPLVITTNVILLETGGADVVLLEDSVTDDDAIELEDAP